MNAREEWLQARRAGLGGSDIGAMLGLSKYRTPADVWLEKTGRAPGQEETLQMRFGTYAEEFVAQEYCAKTGQAVQRFTKMLHHPTAPVLGNVDRLVVPAGAKVASHKGEVRTDKLLECKTASAFAAYNADEWGDEGTDAVPMSYLIQCATYMALTGCSYADLAVLFGNQEVRIYSLKRDTELETEIIARATEWWNRHVIADVAPAPICEADVRALFPSSAAGKTIEAVEETLTMLEALKKAKAEIKALEETADTAALAIKALLGDAEALTLNGKPLLTWKSSKPAMRFDTAAFKLAHPALYSAFLKAGEPARRFLIKD
jgi:putative phage-type endonuclease